MDSGMTQSSFRWTSSSDSLERSLVPSLRVFDSAMQFAVGDPDVHCVTAPHGVGRANDTRPVFIPTDGVASREHTQRAQGVQLTGQGSRASIGRGRSRRNELTESHVRREHARLKRRRDAAHIALIDALLETVDTSRETIQTSGRRSSEPAIEDAAVALAHDDDEWPAL